MQVVAQSPFHEESADVILRSSNGVNFFAHKIILSLASPIFSDMFSIPQPSTGGQEATRPIVDVTEDDLVLDSLLRYIYPVYNPSFTDFNVLDGVLAVSSPH